MTKRLTCGECPWGRTEPPDYDEVICPHRVSERYWGECQFRRIFRILRDEIRALNKLAKEQDEALRALMKSIGAGVC